MHVGIILYMIQCGSLPEYAKACGATPDIDHENSSYEAVVSQRIWERVIEFGMESSLLGLAAVNKVAGAACNVWSQDSCSARGRLFYYRAALDQIQPGCYLI